MPQIGFGKVTGTLGGTALLPSFFIIGPPRTGTSWLQSVLGHCAQLAYPTKETRFFDTHFDRGLAWYSAHFRNAADGRVVGEVAPTYFASPDARERIARLIPHAKIVCTFRNPLDRVISLYRLKKAYGWISCTFDEALRNDPELLESSHYAAHLKQWTQIFGSSQVLATVYDDIHADPQSYVDKLLDFVGIPRLKLLPSHLRHVLTSEDMTEPRHYHWTRAGLLLAEWAKRQRLDWVLARAKKLGALRLFVGGGAPFPEISPDQLVKLRRLFLPEIEELEAALNRDFSAWKTGSVNAGVTGEVRVNPAMAAAISEVRNQARGAAGLPAKLTST